MKRTAILAAILAVVAFGTMADKCTFAPTDSTPPAQQKEEPTTTPEAPKPAQ